MQLHKLERTGEPDVAFVGELIARSDGRRLGGHPLQVCWHDLRLFRTAGGTYVVEVIFSSVMQLVGNELVDEFDWSWVGLVQGDKIADVFRSYESAMNDPRLLDRVRDTVSGPSVLESIRRRYAAQVAELLRDVATGRKVR